ncbi:hypothetical protein ACFE04_026453 [Oxalis oulophora]
MQEHMNISVNGQSQVPPGFRFHPTEEELLNYYLKKKVSFEKIDLDVIRDVDLNKLEPWDIQEECKIGTAPQNDWYFFSHKDKKYPTGTRTNRATAIGFWKATGRDKVIFSNCNRIGMRKTLVFYKGRAPHGQKSDWIMHEYRLDDNVTTTTSILEPSVSNVMGEGAQEEGWVVCRIFKKKNHIRTLDDHPMSSNSLMNISGTIRRPNMFCSSNEGALEQLLQYMGSCKGEDEGSKNVTTSYQNMKLPELESPSSPTSQSYCYQHDSLVPNNNNNLVSGVAHDQPNSVYNNNDNYNMINPSVQSSNWAELDRLVASQLNGQCESSFNYIHDPTISFCAATTTDDHHELQQLPTLRSSSSSSLSSNNNEMDLVWNFTRPPSSLTSSNAI